MISIIGRHLRHLCELVNADCWTPHSKASDSGAWHEPSFALMHPLRHCQTSLPKIDIHGAAFSD